MRRVREVLALFTDPKIRHRVDLYIGNAAGLRVVVQVVMATEARENAPKPGVSVGVFEDLSNDGRLGDEGDDLHFFAATPAGQRVELEDAVDELGPSFSKSASRRGLALRLGHPARASSSASFANAVGVCAVQMNQMLVGLGDVNEDSCQELEGSSRASSSSSGPDLGS